MLTDPISDFLTRIRNAQMAKHRIVEIPASKLKKRITEILYDQGYILKYKFEEAAEGNPQGAIKIALKYDLTTKTPVIKNIERVSKPGLRIYSGAESLGKIRSGLGISIISTSKGLMTDKEAKRLNIGGEIICRVF
ncbi:MAG: 30S ribosomal protein S8 [Bacteroidota bacterium]